MPITLKYTDPRLVYSEHFNRMIGINSLAKDYEDCLLELETLKDIILIPGLAIEDKMALQSEIDLIQNEYLPANNLIICRSDYFDSQETETTVDVPFDRIPLPSEPQAPCFPSVCWNHESGQESLFATFQLDASLNNGDVTALTTLIVDLGHGWFRVGKLGTTKIDLDSRHLLKDLSNDGWIRQPDTMPREWFFRMLLRDLNCKRYEVCRENNTLVLFMAGNKIGELQQRTGQDVELILTPLTETIRYYLQSGYGV